MRAIYFHFAAYVYFTITGVFQEKETQKFRPNTQSKLKIALETKENKRMYKYIYSIDKSL